jgi:hypothetical protein
MFEAMRIVALCTIAVFWSALLGNAGNEPSQAVNAEAAIYDAFQKRVNDYAALLKESGSTVPAVPAKATPEQIDARQRALGQLMSQARKNARKGDVFGPDMPGLVRKRLAPIFRGPKGAEIRSAIVEEPHPVVPAVNVRYPDEVPLSTMPPDVLAQLPKLPDGLEFRFIGRHLILLDVQSHLIVDVIDNAMPA